MQLGLPEHLSSIRCGFVFPISCFWSILDLKLIRVWVAKIKCDVFVIIPFAYQQTKLKPESMATTCLNLCWVSHPKHQIEVPFFLPAPNMFSSINLQALTACQLLPFNMLNSDSTEEVQIHLTGACHQFERTIAKQNRYNGNPDIPEATTWLWVHLLWHQDRGVVVGCGPPFHIFFGLPRWFPGRSFLSILEEEDVQWPVFHQVAQPPMSFDCFNVALYCDQLWLTRRRMSTQQS